MLTVRVGTTVKVAVAFSDIAKAPFDPDVVTCVIVAPDRVYRTYVYGVDDALIRASVGSYYLWVDTPDHGHYTYGFAGTGAHNVSNEDAFVAERTEAFRKTTATVSAIEAHDSMAT